MEVCPHCKSNFHESKGYVERRIKHSLFLGKDTLFVLKEPRYECKGCGKSFISKNSFAPTRSRLSYETIIQILTLSMEWNSTSQSIAKICHVSPTTVQNVFDNYVNIKRRTLPKILSIDECYNCNLFKDPYSCILFDFEKMKIVDIIQDRSKYNLVKYFNKIKPEERRNVQYVVMDMWEPYLDVAKITFPNATVAIDSFHVLQNISRALNKVRCRVMNRYDTNTKEYYLLKKHAKLIFEDPFIWEEKQENKKLHKYINRRQLLDMMLSIDEELKTAHEFYATYKRYNEAFTYEQMKERYSDFSCNLKAALINEFSEVITMLQNWEEYILNSFITVDGRRLSNGPIEGFNSNFKKVLNVANGYANFLRFRNKIIFCYNKEFKITPVKEKIPKIKRKKRGKYAKKKPPNETV